MKRSIPILYRAVFALGILGSLTFGATQAFGFSLPHKAADRPWCQPLSCNQQCGGYGICQNNVCLCY